MIFSKEEIFINLNAQENKHNKQRKNQNKRTMLSITEQVKIAVEERDRCLSDGYLLRKKIREGKEKENDLFYRACMGHKETIKGVDIPKQVFCDYYNRRIMVRVRMFPDGNFLLQLTEPVGIDFGNGEGERYFSFGYICTIRRGSRQDPNSMYSMSEIKANFRLTICEKVNKRWKAFPKKRDDRLKILLERIERRYLEISPENRYVRTNPNSTLPMERVKCPLQVSPKDITSRVDATIKFSRDFNLFQVVKDWKEEYGVSGSVSGSV